MQLFKYTSLLINKSYNIHTSNYSMYLKKTSSDRAKKLVYFADGGYREPNPYLEFGIIFIVGVFKPHFYRKTLLHFP